MKFRTLPLVVLSLLTIVPIAKADDIEREIQKRGAFCGVANATSTKISSGLLMTMLQAKPNQFQIPINLILRFGTPQTPAQLSQLGIAVKWSLGAIVTATGTLCHALQATAYIDLVSIDGSVPVSPASAGRRNFRTR